MDLIYNDGLPKEETQNQHYTMEEYKKITNFKQTKKTLKNIKLELPNIPKIDDIKINRLSKKRDEKILEEIIKPKDNVIQNLYQDNLNLHEQLTRQAKLIEESEKYQKERDKILTDNEKLHNTVNDLKKEYQDKSFNLEWEYKSKIRKLEKENNHLHKVVDKFKDTVHKFIKWIVEKFDITDENKLVRDFERENHILIDAEKQVKREDREKDLDLER